jgi:hypothetical protein
MYVGKARSLPYSGASKRYFTLVGSGLTHKHLTWLERLAKDKRSSLLQKIVNYGCKNFYSTGPSREKLKSANNMLGSKLLPGTNALGYLRARQGGYLVG